MYMAALALIGLSISSTKMFAVASYCTAVWPALTTVMVLVFAVLELRIRGATLHNQRTITPKVEALREANAVPPLLEWEAQAGRWLTRAQNLMASSVVLVLVITLPALGGVAWHLLGDVLPHSIWHPTAAALNGIVLLTAALFASWASVAPDSRRASAADAERRAVTRSPARPLARSRS
jgi:hypothetical protein